MAGQDDTFVFPHGEAIVGAFRVPPSLGLSLRDAFAMAALAGFCTLHDGEGDVLIGAADTARAAYNYADEMMAARAPEPVPAAAPLPNDTNQCPTCGTADWRDCDFVPF